MLYKQRQDDTISLNMNESMLPKNKIIESQDSKEMINSEKRESERILKQFDRKADKIVLGTYTMEHLVLFFNLRWPVLEPALATKFKVEVKDDNVTLKKLE